MGESLSKPITEKHTSTFETRLLNVGCSGMQGWRKSMEDSHVAQLNVGGDVYRAAFGVFDGHNGYNVAKYCGSHMVDMMMQQPAFGAKRYGQAVADTFMAIDECLAGNPEHQDGGCTAVGVVLGDGKICCANAGDSRAISVFDDGSVVPLSEDHKPTSDGELARIKAAGGSVDGNRVGGALAVSRAVGDFQFKADKTRSLADQVITARADVREVPILDNGKKAKYIILACDGVWDVVSNRECADFVTAKMSELANDVGLVCEALLDHCLAQAPGGAGTDNMTVIVVEIKSTYYA